MTINRWIITTLAASLLACAAFADSNHIKELVENEQYQEAIDLLQQRELELNSAPDPTPEPVSVSKTEPGVKPTANPELSSAPKAALKYTSQQRQQLQQQQQQQQRQKKQQQEKQQQQKSHPEIANAIGWISLKQGDYTKADEYLKKSLRLADEDGNIEVAGLASNNLGILHYLQNNLDESRGYFTSSYSAGSSTAKLYLGLIETKETQLNAQKALVSGVEMRRAKDFKAAIAEYDKSLAFQPRNAAALEFKGYALLRDGDYPSALSVLLKARELEPQRKFTHLNLIKVQCLLKSETGVQQMIDESKLPTQQIAQWHRVDAEFRRMCSASDAIKGLLAESAAQM